MHPSTDDFLKRTHDTVLPGFKQKDGKDGKDGKDDSCLWPWVSLDALNPL